MAVALSLLRDCTRWTFRVSLPQDCSLLLHLFLWRLGRLSCISSDNNAQASILQFFEDGLFLTGLDDDGDDDNGDGDGGGDGGDPHQPRPNIHGFYTCSRKMALRSVMCRENGYDLMDSDLMLVAETKEISWKFLERVDISHNPLWESRGKTFLQKMLPIDITSTSRAHKQAVIDAQRAEAAAAAAEAEAAKIVGSPHLKLSPTKSTGNSPTKGSVAGGAFSGLLVPPPEIMHFRLRVLDVSFCDLNNAAIEYIAEVMSSGNLQLLEELRLSGNKMSKVGLEVLLGVINKPFTGDDMSEGGSRTGSPTKKPKPRTATSAGAGADQGPLMSLLGDFASSLAQPLRALSKKRGPPPAPTKAVEEEDDDGVPEKLFESSLESRAPRCPLLRKLDLSLNPLNSDGMSALVGVLLRGGVDQLEELDISRVGANADSIMVVSRAFNEQYMKPLLLPSGQPVKAVRPAPVTEDEAAAMAGSECEPIHLSAMRLRSLKLYADIVPLSRKAVCFGKTMLRQVKIS